MIVARTEISPGDVALHYDEIDRFYRELWGLHLHHGLFRTGEESPETAVEALIQLVQNRTHLRPGDRVCDVGCGYGGTVRYLAEKWGADVIGFTLSKRQHQFARDIRTSRGRCEILLQDWLDNQLDDETFDAVIAIESTEHMVDKARCCEQAFRVLRPGGRLVICAWTADPAASAEDEKRLLEPICREGRLPGMANGQEYRAWLQQAGFKKIHSEDLSQLVAPTWTICARRVVWRLASRPSSWFYLLNSRNRNRVFLRTVFRMRRAYRKGCLRDHLFAGRKSETRQESC